MGFPAHQILLYSDTVHLHHSAEKPNGFSADVYRVIKIERDKGRKLFSTVQEFCTFFL